MSFKSKHTHGRHTIPCIAFPVTPPIPPPIPPSCPPHKQFVSNEICGNILLTAQQSMIEIWKTQTTTPITITLSVFSSANNTHGIQITIYSLSHTSIDYFVPPGNTRSITIEKASSISIKKESIEPIEGTYCLHLSFFTSQPII